jgi:short-subunit dehydrogenase
MSARARPVPPLDGRRTAIVIGASSGIGEAMARRLAKDGWRLGVAARRLDWLESLATELGDGTVVCRMDLSEPESAAVALERMIAELVSVDLLVISSGTGHLNPDLEWPPDRETLMVNVVGFAAVASVGMRHFLQRKSGHLVGVSSVQALRGTGVAATYAASKAFVSCYLDGLRDWARRSGFAITVTEAQPGFVDTAMMKTDRPFWVATPDKAAAQIMSAIQRRAKHAYITKRWGIVAYFLRLLPRPG